MAHYLLTSTRHFEVGAYKARNLRKVRAAGAAAKTDETFDPEGGTPAIQARYVESYARDLVMAAVQDGLFLVKGYKLEWPQWTTRRWEVRLLYLEALAWTFGPSQRHCLDFVMAVDFLGFDPDVLRRGLLTQLGAPGPALTLADLQDRHRDEIEDALSNGPEFFSWRRQGVGCSKKAVAA